MGPDYAAVHRHRQAPIVGAPGGVGVGRVLLGRSASVAEGPGVGGRSLAVGGSGRGCEGRREGISTGARRGRAGAGQAAAYVAQGLAGVAAELLIVAVFARLEDVVAAVGAGRLVEAKMWKCLYRKRMLSM